MNEFICISCNTKKSLRDFYKSRSPLFVNGHVPCCKDCLSEEDVSTQQKVLDVLRKLDVPYVFELWNRVTQEYPKKEIGNYLRLIALKQPDKRFNDSEIFQGNRYLRKLNEEIASQEKKLKAITSVRNNSINTKTTDIDVSDVDNLTQDDMGIDDVELPDDGWEEIEDTETEQDISSDNAVDAEEPNEEEFDEEANIQETNNEEIASDTNSFVESVVDANTQYMANTEELVDAYLQKNAERIHRKECKCYRRRKGT